MSRERFAPNGPESGRDPSADRLLVNLEEVGKFDDLVSSMEFDAAVVEPPRHVLLRSLD
jgi:hypothetical protein